MVREVDDDVAEVVAEVEVGVVPVVVKLTVEGRGAMLALLLDVEVCNPNASSMYSAQNFQNNFFRPPVSIKCSSVNQELEKRSSLQFLVSLSQVYFNSFYTSVWRVSSL